MWTYLFLLLVRIFFAISPSYIHPDENFQGPEVIAGEVYNFPHHQTWEFTSSAPVRSIFPLWPVYSLPMLVLKGVWAGGAGTVQPEIVYYALRILMFILSFVLEDWAIHELVQSPRYRKHAATLVASSYITWTYQTHTFSNSIETLAVLWTLVMIQRIRAAKHRDSLLSSTILGAIVAFGFFNRITFPAFTAIPLLTLLPHFSRHVTSLITTSSAFIAVSALAILADTQHYNPNYSFLTALKSPTITPLNSLLYNSSSSNLSNHGIHPFYQHVLINLPQLLGPALFLLPSTFLLSPTSLPTISILSSLAILTLVPHQEARFLIPLAPLCLSVIRLPQSRRYGRYWLASWIIFNTLLGFLMGSFHQGGVIPGQIWLGKQNVETRDKGGRPIEQVFWWRTYPPPIYLLGKESGISTTDLMGMRFEIMQKEVRAALGNCREGGNKIGLVAPWSSVEIDAWVGNSTEIGLKIEKTWHWDRHLNLDDMDFAEDGVVRTLRRVIGRRGLVIWTIEGICDGRTRPVLGFDW